MMREADPWPIASSLAAVRPIKRSPTLQPLLFMERLQNPVKVIVIGTHCLSLWIKLPHIMFDVLRPDSFMSIMKVSL